MSKKHILFTGLGGTVGKGILEAKSPDTEIIHLGTKPIDHPGVTYVRADFTNPTEEWDLPDVDIDGIVHLSQSPEYREFPHKALNIFHVNTHSTLRLLDLALKRNIPQFVYASTGGVYPFHEEAHKENGELKFWDAGFYNGSKLCSEIVVDSYKNLMFTKVIRFFFVYGPSQPAGMLMPRLLNSVKQGNPITLFGEEGLRINPIYYKDAGKAIWNLLEKEESLKVNIGGTEVLSLKQIGEIMGKVAGKEPVFETREANPANPQALLGNISFLKNNIFSPEYSFEEGIKNMISYAV